MDPREILQGFFRTIGNDPRIGASHISLYCALYQQAVRQDAVVSVFFIKPDIMKAAKISGLATFHRRIRELHDYGYIHYNPSYYHRKKSSVYFHPF
jgi:hypothetical protein